MAKQRTGATMARRKKTNNRRSSAATQESRAEETTQRRQSDEESGFPARCRRNAALINDRNIVANSDDFVVIRDVFVVVVVEVVVDSSDTNPNRSRRRGGIGRGSRSGRARCWGARPQKQRRRKSHAQSAPTGSVERNEEGQRCNETRAPIGPGAGGAFERRRDAIGQNFRVSPHHASSTEKKEIFAVEAEKQSRETLERADAEAATTKKSCTERLDRKCRAK